MSDSNFLSPNEAALAVVATAKKKSRLPIQTLFLNSILGGIFISTSGMLFVMIEAGSLRTDTWFWAQICQGSIYTIGLTFIILFGVDLYNSNILFFSVGILRRQVTLIALIRSWVVSFFGNLGGSLFYAYVIVHLGGLTSTPDYIEACKKIADNKIVGRQFHQSLLRGIGGNFLVSIAIYLAIFSKPFTSKVLGIFLPIFTFVSSGLEHVVADMLLIPVGLFHHPKATVAEYIWRSMIPVAIGNAIGGFFFALMVPFYLHLYVVDKDRAESNLPLWETRDEQPDLQMDSRVVRVPTKMPGDSQSTRIITNNYTNASLPSLSRLPSHKDSISYYQKDSNEDSNDSSESPNRDGSPDADSSLNVEEEPVPLNHGNDQGIVKHKLNRTNTTSTYDHENKPSLLTRAMSRISTRTTQDLHKISSISSQDPDRIQPMTEKDYLRRIRSGMDD